MKIGNIELTKEDFPSYVDFASNPKHIYTSMQDILSGALQVNALANPQLMNAMATPPQSKENKQNQWSN